MAFNTDMLWGVHVWIWVLLLFVVVFVSGIFIYYLREQIKGKYYKIRWPERVIGLCIIFPDGTLITIWRLIPKDQTMPASGGEYFYDVNCLIRPKDLFIYRDDAKDHRLKAEIDGQPYYVDDALKLRHKWDKYPRLFYIYGNPNPLDFRQTNAQALGFSAIDLQNYHQNNLIKKFMTIEGEKSLITMLMVLVGINLLATLFIVGKIMGLIK